MVLRPTVFALLVVLLPAAVPAAGPELSLLAGTSIDRDSAAGFYPWQLELRNWMNEGFAVSISYLNEGHTAYHHRDGGAVQAWAQTGLFVPGLSLSAGIGPYYYFDTMEHASGMDYTNEHGWGTIGSLELTWQAGSRLNYQLRANAVNTGPLDSRTVLIGAGYRWDSRHGPAEAMVPPAYVSEKANELTLFAGRTIVNSLDSEHSLAAAIELRRRLGRFVEGTLGVLDEGEAETLDRMGATVQLWLVREFLNDRVSLGLGGGGYYAADHEHQPGHTGGSGYFLSGIASLTASYRIAESWRVRTTWSRIHSHYDRDADAVMLGLGYVF